MKDLFRGDLHRLNRKKQLQQFKVKHSQRFWFWKIQSCPTHDAVDGSEIRLSQRLRLVVDPIIYVALYIPGGAKSLPSTCISTVEVFGHHFCNEFGEPEENFF